MLVIISLPPPSCAQMYIWSDGGNDNINWTGVAVPQGASWSH